MKFIRRLLILVIAFLLIDQLAGVACRYLFAHVKGGTGRAYYIENTLESDMLILGSSRAIHHYNPAIIGDSMQMSVYNGGMDGNGIIYNYGIWKLVTQRSYPKIIVYEVTPIYDIWQGDNERYLSGLKYFFGKSAIDSIFLEVSSPEFVFSHIALYQYNSKMSGMIKDCFSPKQYIGGFYSLSNELDVVIKPSHLFWKTEDREYDEVKIKYLKKLMQECQGHTQIFFVASPLYLNTRNEVLDTIKTLCKQYGATFIDYSLNAEFNNDRSLFRDATHMNGNGANKFSSVFAHDLKTLLRQ